MVGLSLFSGIGGIDLAFEWAGGTVGAVCEIEPFCQQVLKKHWPTVPIFENVYDLTGDKVKETTGYDNINIIYGGFPCQPFSVAGKQKGKADNRYLWPEFSRLVKELRPDWVVGENVPGILHLAADDVCQDLESQNYEVGIFDFEAAAVGAPHRRERFFFVAHSMSVQLQGINKSCSSKAMEDTRCRVCQRNTVTREVCREQEAREANGAERSGEVRATYIPNSNFLRRYLWGLKRQGVHRADPSCCETPPDTNSAGREEQRGPITALPQFRRAECGGGWGSEPGVGRGTNGLPKRVDRATLDFWSDGSWDMGPRTGAGIPNRVARLKALGNAVVPQQIYPIFKAIMEFEEDNYEIKESAKGEIE